MVVLALPDSPHRDLPPPHVSAGRGRVLAIDLVRGLLMCVIAVGHSLILLEDSEWNRWMRLVILKVTNLGTPGFTLISGLLLGYFEWTHPDFQRIRRKYFMRGLQLLLLAHPLIALATYPLRQERSFGVVYLLYWYITDTLAILFMALPTLVPRLNARARMIIGVLFLLSSKGFSLFPLISSPLLLVMKEFFFGVSPHGPHLLGDTYPIIPLAGLFMIGTVLGNIFARSLVGGTLDRFESALRRSIPPLTLLSGFLVGSWAWGKGHSESPLGNTLKILFYPEKLSSLLPFYIALLFLILVYFIRRVEIKRPFGQTEKALALLGKTSLFTYVAQYFLVQTVPSLIGWRNQMNAIEMILYSGGTLMLLLYLARAYNNALFFLKRWSRASKAIQPGESKPERTFPSPEIPPEVLDLKKDLW